MRHLGIFSRTFIASIGLLAAFDLMAAPPVDWAVVQRELKAQALYFGPVDGRPGEETTAAVNRFQIRKGLPVTGQVDKATWAALNTRPTKPAEPTTPAKVESTPAPQLNTWFEPALTDSNSVALSLDQLFADTSLSASSRARKSAALSEVQERMRTANTYNGQVDGEPGPKIHQGLLDYQAKSGLPQTAAADSATLAAMGLDPATLGASADRRSTSRRSSGREREPDVFKKTGRTVGKFFRRVF